MTDLGPACFDPYDLWSTDLGLRVRRWFYGGRRVGIAGAVAVSLADLVAPRLARAAAGCRPRVYPIVVAHGILRAAVLDRLDEARAAAALETLRRLAVHGEGDPSWAWGLGFPWMSKNGLYPPSVPFVTHTPYVLEALLTLRPFPAIRRQAEAMFHGSWAFLEDLRVMDEGDDYLAVSYAPVDEPRIVVNANSYAAFAYALHAREGTPERRPRARQRATRLAAWVVSQQRPDGLWTYYADEAPGNFIDCFHTAFVLKNLHKVRQLLPELDELVRGALHRGYLAFTTHFFDAGRGLYRRFARRSHTDLIRWDLYDQAEALGLLVDRGEIAAAQDLAAQTEKRFRRGARWATRISLIGTPVGRDFRRWGIEPFRLHRARLARLLEEKG